MFSGCWFRLSFLFSAANLLRFALPYTAGAGKDPNGVGAASPLQHPVGTSGPCVRACRRARSDMGGADGGTRTRELRLGRPFGHLGAPAMMIWFQQRLAFLLRLQADRYLRAAAVSEM